MSAESNTAGVFAVILPRYKTRKDCPEKRYINTHMIFTPHHNNIFTIDLRRNTVGAEIYSRCFSSVIFDFYYC